MPSLEIATLMYIFGDVKTPKLQSVQMMVKILRDQMNLLLLKAEENVCLQQGIIITHGDVLFIIRNNKIKLKRLIEYFKTKDLKCGSNVNKDHLYTMDSHLKQRYWRMCLEFLATIEDCGEFTSIMKDETIMDISLKKRKMRQQWRINLMTQSEQEEYLKLCKEIARPLPDFKEWLLEDGITDLDLTECALSIMEFLARETIYEIIDMVLLLKMRKLGRDLYLLRDYSAHLVQVESDWKADICHASRELIDESRLRGNNTIWNESCSELPSDFVPVDIDESSKETPSKQQTPSKRHATDVFSDVSDECGRSAPDTEFSDLSDGDLLDALQNDSPADDLGNDSQASKLNYDLSDISEPSDPESTECEIDDCEKKSRRRRRSRSCCRSEAYTCHFPEEFYTFDASTATTHLSISARNEVKYVSPIETSEIVDAFARFQEPLPLVKIFHNNRPVPRKTKLICLFDSLSVDNL